MKTVGIITAHCSANPGASLQAHALCKKISELGYQPVIIDYRPNNFIDIAERAENGTATDRERLKMFVLRRRLSKRYRFFQEFETSYYPKKTKCYQSVEQINDDPPVLDAYLCGSDQIWNPQHVNYNLTYFLDFAKTQTAPRISYAASIGQDVVDERGCDFLKAGIENLDHISVREDTAKVLLQDQIGINRPVAQHIDPTMLYPASYWRSLERPPEKKLPEKYILYYPLQDNSIEEALNQEVKKSTGLPCVALCSAMKKPSFADLQICEYGPLEFLYLIDHAEIVTTNSFHGIVLSLIFRTNIVPYRNPVRNSRIESLFRTLGLPNMQMDSVDTYQEQNWSALWDASRKIDEALRAEQVRATAYLTEVLP